MSPSTIMQALDWAYDKAINGVAGLDSASELAKHYRSKGGSRVDQANSLIRWQVEVDEAYFGGVNANKHPNKKIKNANGTAGKTAVVGIKDRETNQVQAAVVERTNQETLQAFVNARKEDGAKVYTDEHGAYIGLDNHEVVKHSVGEYVNEQAHTNGIESFWSMLKRAHKGTFHKLSPKHLQRYVNEFAGRHNIRALDTTDQMTMVASGMVGRFLSYEDLIEPNGLAAGAQA